MGSASRQAILLSEEGGLLVRDRSAWGPFRRERAALGRLGVRMRAEMAELAPGSWARWRLESDLTDEGWGELVLPELTALLRASDPPGVRVPTACECRPSARDMAVLQRLGALMRREASELAAWGSPLARRLECWGIRLVLDCECPQRPCPPPRRGPVHPGPLTNARYLHGG